MQYCLEIYSPGKTDTVLANIMSDGPFMPIERGALLDPRAWEGATDLVEGGLALRVTDSEHIVSERLHKIMIYTREVSHVREEVRWK